MRCSVYIVCPVVLRCSNLKLHQTLEVKNISKQEKIMLNVNVNLLSNHPAPVINGIARSHTSRRSPLARFFFEAYIFVWIYENGVKELDSKPSFEWTFRPSLGPLNGQKHEGQCKEDKRVEEGKKNNDFAFNFHIVDFGDSFCWVKNARLGREFNWILISLNF